MSLLRAIAAIMACLFTATGCSVINDVFSSDCTIDTGDHKVHLDADQAANTATIAAVGITRGAPDRAIVIAIATAWQESTLRNLEHGDRDSLGLFQQRPSQGWGTPDEILDPVYAATKFYEKLDTIPEWETMRVTDAAQAVQRSAHPEKYQQWSDNSLASMRTFTGDAKNGITCNHHSKTSSPPDNVAAAIQHIYRDQPISIDDNQSLSIPVETVRQGWQYTAWLIAHSHEHGLTSVTFEHQTWTADTGTWTTSNSISNFVTATTR